ncbi:unnamed protein product [Brachionus calyciflorus]|uniref:Uncharacterized protein n=1 Tax=Brachionus calyciflorus TaxID=104777 RepID=A0A813VI89_9BILA|nr:unnamed protein product [Brachionus calyciflorus]
MSVNKKYQKAVDLLMSGTSNEDVIIGSIDEFTEEELSEMSDYLLINDNLIITASSGRTHDTAKNLLVRGLVNGIRSLSKENSEKYNYFVAYSVPYVDIFKCGRIIDKHADSVIRLKENEIVSFPLVIEVAHGSESLKTLIIELLNYMSEFSETIYAIGFYIDRKSESFTAQLIVLRRMLPVDKKKSDALLNAIKNRKKNRHFEMACPQGGIKPVPFFIIDFKKFISDNNAELFYDYEINESNMNDNIEFRLRAGDFNGEDGQFINIVISSSTINDIYSEWRIWRNEKKQP